MNYLIIAAGGNGERLKLPYNKIFAKIGRHSIISWTLKAFENSAAVDKIIISARAEDISKINQLIQKHKFKKILNIIEADKSRQESTFKVLKWLNSKINSSDLVGVHNGVNPFVSHDEIVEVFAAAQKYGASLLAYPATDTVKITNYDDFVTKTPLRQYSWYAQTPQVATFAALYKAFTKADKENFMGTDDTQLLERINVNAKIIKCSHRNFKITFPEDLVVAKNILKNIQKSNNKIDSKQLNKKSYVLPNRFGTGLPPFLSK